MNKRNSPQWTLSSALRPRWAKVFKDLWDNKTRTLLVVFSIAIGVFAIGMISGAYSIIQSDMGRSYAAANPANIQFRTSSFDQNFVETVINENGVKDAEGRRLFSVRVRSSVGIWKSIDLVALNDFHAIRLNLLDLLEGSPTPEKGEILLENGARTELAVDIGDQLEIELSDGSTRKLTVAGIVLDQTTSAGDFLASPLAYIEKDSLEWLKQPVSYNTLYVTVNDKPNDENHIRSISNQVADKLEKSDTFIFRTRISLRNQHPMESTVQAILSVLGVLGILVLLLSSSLIANTINALLNQHIRHIGVMKLVGARNNQIFGMYFLMILAYSLIALLIAVPAGVQAAYLFSLFIANELNFTILGFRIIPSSVILQIIIGISVPLAAGFIPIRNGSRITVLQAISGDSSSDKIPKKEKINSPAFLFHKFHISIPKLNLPRPLILSLRNTFRKRGRLALTLFTLTMGGAIFIAVFNVRTTLRQFIDQVGNYFLADVTMGFNRLYRVDEINDLTSKIPGVAQVEGWSFVSGEILDQDGDTVENLVILAPPAASSLVDPILLSGRWLRPGDQRALAVSEAIWKRYPNLKPGDPINLKVDGKKDTWIVVGIFKFVDREGVIAYANYEYISPLINQYGKSGSFRVVLNDHSKQNQEKMSAELDRYFRWKGYQVGQIEPGLSSLKVASEGLDVLVTFLMIMALLTASVGSMGLTGTMGMNIMERTREIGIMRSIGAIDREVFKNVVVEGMLIGFISWVLGALLSFPISAALSYIISIAIFNTPLTPSFTILGFAIWLGLVFVLSALASILPARTATRLTIREVLSYE